MTLQYLQVGAKRRYGLDPDRQAVSWGIPVQNSLIQNQVHDFFGISPLVGLPVSFDTAHCKGGEQKQCVRDYFTNIVEIFSHTRAFQIATPPQPPEWHGSYLCGKSHNAPFRAVP